MTEKFFGYVLQAGLLVLLGLKYSSIWIRACGYAALALAILRALIIDSWQLSGGELTVTYALLIVALAACTWMLYRRPDLLKVGYTAPYVFAITTGVTTLMLLAIDVLSGDGPFGGLDIAYRVGIVSISWLIVALIGIVVGASEDYGMVRATGYGILYFALFKIMVFDSWQTDFGMRTFVFTIAIASLAISMLIINDRVTKPSSTEQGLVPINGVLAVFFFTVGTAIEFLDSNGMLAALSGNARTVTLSIVWVLVALALIALGFTNGSRVSRACGIALFGIAVLKVLVFDLDSLPSIYRVIVTILIGLVALGASYYYVKNKDRLAQLWN